MCVPELTEWPTNNVMCGVGFELIPGDAAIEFLSYGCRYETVPVRLGSGDDLWGERAKSQDWGQTGSPPNSDPDGYPADWQGCSLAMRARDKKPCGG